MELFKLLGTIAIENAEAKKALQETGQEGEKTQSKLSTVFGAIGKGAAVVGKGIAVGLTAGATAMTGLTVKALNLSGDLEQNLGGAQQVFKELGGSIGEMSTKIITGYDEATGKAIYATSDLEKVSKDAYKNMGLSQSDYLATANKMGALFQGAGFETQEALDLSSQAMQRAADVASIMGIDTEAAMEAVAGAAKGNFTMMDNLGVAMNDTAIGAYALEKGIKKSTSEMSQQEKIGLAMEMFMDKTAYAAGNYAKENETLAGSLGTAKSALTNFLSGSGDVESVVSSFSNLANVVIKSLGDIVPRLTTGLTDIVNQVAPMLPGLLNQLLPVIVQGATSLVNGLVTALPGIVSAITAVLPTLIEGVMQIIVGIAQALPQMIQTIIAALPQVIQAIVAALPALIPALINGLVQMFTSLCTMLPQIIQPIINYLPSIIISIVNALVQNLPVLIQGLISLITGIIPMLPQIIQSLVDALPQIIAMIITALLQNLPAIITGLIQVVMGIVVALPQIFASLLSAVPAIFQGLWDGIKNVFSGVGEWFSNMWNSLGNVPGLSSLKTMIENVWGAIKSNITTTINVVKNVVTTVWNSIKNVISTVLNSIKNVISTAWNAVKTIISNVMKLISSVLKGDWEGVKSAISNILNAIKSVIKSIWDGIKNTISSVLNGIKNVVSSVWNGIKTLISTGMNNMKTIITSVWNGIKGTISGVVNGIKTTVTKGFNNVKNAVVNTVKSLPGKIKNVGLDIVKGIGNGITNGTKWIKNKIKSFVGNVTKFLKKLFKIKSPSQVMRDEVGAMLAEGVAVGIDENTSKVQEKAEEMSKKVLDAAQKRLDDYKVYNDLTLADEVAFWDKVRVQCKEGTDARIQADQKYLEAKKSLNDEIASAETELQTTLDEIYKKVEDRAAAIEKTFNLFDAPKVNHTDGVQMFYALHSQVEALEMYQTEIEKLRGRIGGTDLFKEIESMGVDALFQVKELNELTDTSLDIYMNMYNKRSELAKEIATSELQDETQAATEKAYQDFANEMAGLGVEIVEETEAMKTEAVNNFNAMLDEFTNALASFSPTMKLPHFKVDGSFDLETGTVPTFSVEWFKKAMNNAMLLDKPTIFGYDTASGNYLGAGDAGSEVVAGSTTLMNMIQNAVATQNSGLIYYLQKIVDILATFFPEQIEAFRNMKLQLNTGALVGELVVPMDQALGKLSTRKDRGR